MLLNSKLLLLALTTLALSCASTKKESASNDIDTTPSEPSRIQSHLIDTTPPVCRDCIIGAIGDSELLNSKSKVYRLEGADDLNLSNYHFDIPVEYNCRAIFFNTPDKKCSSK